MGSEYEPETVRGSNLYLSTIRVMSYTSRVLKGTIYNPYFGEQTFLSTMELVLIMEQQMKELECPQDYQQSRRLSQNLECPGTTFCQRPSPYQRSLATIQLHVAFRRNASWQGKIVWPSRRTEQNFRSVLELMMLMDSALSAVALKVYSE